MNLNQTSISAPGTVMYYDYMYYVFICTQL